MTGRTPTLLVLLALPALGSGCAHWLANQTDESVAAALATVSAPEGVEQLASLLDSPRMQAALAAASRTLAEQSVAAVGDGPSDDRLRRASAALAEGMRPALHALVADDLLGTAEAAVDRALDRVLAELAAAHRRGTFTATAGAVARAVVEATVAALREVVGPTPAAGLGAALARSLEVEVLPAVGRAMDGAGDGDLRPILAGTTRAVSEQAMLGLADAVRGELGDAIEARVASREAAIQAAVDAWIQRTEALAVVSGLLLLATVGLAVWGWRRRSEAVAQEEALALVVQAWCDREGADPAALRALGEGTAAGDAVRRALRRR